MSDETDDADIVLVPRSPTYILPIPSAFPLEFEDSDLEHDFIPSSPPQSSVFNDSRPSSSAGICSSPIGSRDFIFSSQRVTSSPPPPFSISRAPISTPSERRALWRISNSKAVLQSGTGSDGKLFKNTRIYFFPNNDINPARKFRIAKAKAMGATWIKKWSTEVDITHIVVDTGISHRELLSHLNISEAIPPAIIVVNERYIPDCISFKALVDPRQSRYLVSGMPEHRVKPPLSEQLDSILPVAQESVRTPARMVFSGVKRNASESPKVDSPPEPPTRNIVPLSMPVEVEVVFLPQDSQKYSDDLVSVITDISAYDPQALDLIEADEDDGPSQEIKIGMNLKRLRSLLCPSQHSNPPSITNEVTSIPSNPDKKTKYSGFVCMEAHKTESQDSGPNERTIAILQEMHDYYDRIRDQWRAIAYRKAISSLRRQKEWISSRQQAQKIPYIGERLAIKVEEIALTNQLRQLGHAQTNPRDEALQVFMGIYGVGLSLSNIWVSKGLRTLEDLRNNKEIFRTLTANQRVGLDRYDDFQVRIPRPEVAQHAEVVRKVLSAIDPDAFMHVMGSYRRGSSSCGDIDILISKEGASMTELQNILHDSLIPQLTRQGFLKANLVGGGASKRSAKLFGASALDHDSPWRRIDFLIVPPHEVGAAMLYFTGNDVFNRSMRLLASRKGMRLNQHGLFTDVMRGLKRVKMTDGSLLESRSEERIFELLGITWRPPHHRAC